MVNQFNNEPILHVVCKDGDVDLNASPEALDKLLGYSLAFKVKVWPKFRNFVVLKYSSDLDLIQTIVDLLPDAEVLFCDPYFNTYLDTYILYLCSFDFFFVPNLFPYT